MHDHVDALRDGQGKAAAADVLHRHSIGCDQFGGKRSEVYKEIRSTAAVDNPKSHPTALFYLDYLWIKQGAIIGQVSVVVHIIGVGLGGCHLHIVHALRGRRRGRTNSSRVLGASCKRAYISFGGVKL